MIGNTRHECYSIKVLEMLNVVDVIAVLLLLPLNEPWIAVLERLIVLLRF